MSKRRRSSLPTLLLLSLFCCSFDNAFVLFSVPNKRWEISYCRSTRSTGKVASIVAHTNSIFDSFTLFRVSSSVRASLCPWKHQFNAPHSAPSFLRSLPSFTWRWQFFSLTVLFSHPSCPSHRQHSALTLLPRLDLFDSYSMRDFSL